VSPLAPALLTELLQFLAANGYAFTTPTLTTHQRVLAHRRGDQASTLRDVFGWNLPFSASPPQLPLHADLLVKLRDAGLVQAHGESLRATVRVSSLNGDLFVHSAFPTVQDDAVFFGPDTYRFARFIHSGLSSTPERTHRAEQPIRVLDVGCGSGAGGIAVARALAHFHPAGHIETTMNDINPLALDYTAVNAAFAGVQVTLACGDALAAVEGLFDVIVSNPPYLDDPAQRAYRHGGAGLGRALSVRIATEALPRLAPGGRLLLYTGVAMVAGADPFLADMQPVLAQSGCEWSYSEIDVDVFGEELERPAYQRIDRIAAVGLIVLRTTEAA
jgi:methylase of polypeptide subunit release factors